MFTRSIGNAVWGAVQIQPAASSSHRRTELDYLYILTPRYVDQQPRNRHYFRIQLDQEGADLKKGLENGK